MNQRHMVGIELIGAEWFYWPSELETLIRDLSTEVKLLVADATVGASKLTPDEARSVRAFAEEAMKFLGNTGLSVLDPSSQKTVGDKLVELRERAKPLRAMLAAKGIFVSAAPAAPKQRRSDDPRDIADEEERKRKEKEREKEWGWKQYTLVAVLGVAGLFTLGIVGASVIRR